MIQKIFTLDDLKETGLKIVGAHQTASSYGVKVGEYYLKPEVISQWDWKDYSEYYTYFDGSIKFVVNLCFRKDEKTDKYYLLKKDFSNLPTPTEDKTPKKQLEQKDE